MLDDGPQYCQCFQKIKAAAEARRNPDFVIKSRTDAYAPYGLKEAIRRWVRPGRLFVSDSYGTSRSTSGPYCCPPNTSVSSTSPDIAGRGIVILIALAAS